MTDKKTKPIVEQKEATLSVGLRIIRSDIDRLLTELDAGKYTTTMLEHAHESGLMKVAQKADHLTTFSGVCKIYEWGRREQLDIFDKQIAKNEAQNNDT